MGIMSRIRNIEEALLRMRVVEGQGVSIDDTPDGQIISMEQIEAELLSTVEEHPFKIWSKKTETGWNFIVCSSQDCLKETRPEGLEAGRYPNMDVTAYSIAPLFEIELTEGSTYLYCSIPVLGTPPRTAGVFSNVEGVDYFEVGGDEGSRWACFNILIGTVYANSAISQNQKTNISTSDLGLYPPVASLEP